MTNSIIIIVITLVMLLSVSFLTKNVSALSPHSSSVTQTVRRSLGIKMMSTSGSPKAKAETFIKDNNIMVFSKTYCPYCTKAKDALTELGLKFTVYELDKESDGAEVQKALEEITKQRTVPNIFVKSQHIGGCDATLAAISKGDHKKWA